MLGRDAVYFFTKEKVWPDEAHFIQTGNFCMDVIRFQIKRMQLTSSEVKVAISLALGLFT